MVARDWTIAELRASVAQGDISAQDVCETYLQRIGAANGELNALTVVFGDEARAQAEEIDRHRDTWVDRPLLGVPIAIKDVICTRGTPTTAGSRILQGSSRRMTRR